MKHSKYAPSSAHRWLYCTASIQHIENGNYPEQTSKYAEEGTKKHDQFYAIVSYIWKHGDYDHIIKNMTHRGQSIDCILNEYGVINLDDYNISDTDNGYYVDFFMFLENILPNTLNESWLKGKEYVHDIFFEHKIVHENEERFGTPDILIKTYVKDNPEEYLLGILDLKFGYQDVNVIDNSQIDEYLCILTHPNEETERKIGKLDFITADDFKSYGVIIQNGKHKINKIGREHLLRINIIHDDNICMSKYMKRYFARNDICKYCPAKSDCRAHKEYVMSVIPDSVMNQDHRLSLEERKEIFSKKQDIIKFLNSIENDLKYLVNSGENIGMKIKHTKGRMKWKHSGQFHTLERILESKSNCMEKMSLYEEVQKSPYDVLKMIENIPEAMELFETCVSYGDPIEKLVMD